MNRTLIQSLCCPDCKSDLRLMTEERDEIDDVQSGTLRCDECSSDFRIVDGVPDFGAPEPDITSRHFSRQWELKYQGTFEPDGTTYNLKDRSLMRHVIGALVSSDNERARVVDAGCGAGYKTIEAARQFPDTDFIGIDFGPHILTRGKKQAELPNLNFVRASIDRLPVKSEAMDLVFCHGVLHCLERQDDGFAELIRIAKPAAPVSLWLYPQVSDIKSFKGRLALGAYYAARGTFFGQAHRLGARACHVLAFLQAAVSFPVVHPLLSGGMTTYQKSFEGEDYTPRSMRQSFRSLVFVIFDHLIAEIQTHYSIADVEKLSSEHECSSVLSFNDDSGLKFNAIPGFHLIRK